MLHINVVAGRRPRLGISVAARGVARLCGVPRRLAVVAEHRAAPGRQARKLGTRRATGSHHRETGSEIITY